MLFKRKPLVVTHNGDFHADDVFAVAALSLLEGGIRVLRTRDAKRFSDGQYVVDVGGVHDPELRRFDHHQQGGAGKRENGIPYAAFGLVWKEYGAQIAGSGAVAAAIDEKIVAPLDAFDNGVNIYDMKFPPVEPYSIENYILLFRPTWKEETDRDRLFTEAVQVAKTIITREIKRARDREEGTRLVQAAYRTAADKRLLILDGDYPWHEAANLYKDVLFVVRPSFMENQWHLCAVRVEPHLFQNRKDLPASWAGKRDGELAAQTGGSDAVFCHNNRFLAIAKSKEGALKLAELALKA